MEIIKWLVANPGVAGIWSIFGIAVVTLLKTWPTLKKLSMDESAVLRADRRADYRELRSELDRVKHEMDYLKLHNGIVERHATAVDVRMGQLEFIIGMTLDELELKSPGNEVAKKAREMFGRLYPVPPLTDELEALKKKLDPLHSPIAPQPSVPGE